MPPVNEERRNALADAAIELVARDGLHGLSHRAVDERSVVPPGTTSNYFRSRDALLEAAMRRVVQLHFTMLERLRADHAGTFDRDGVIEFLSRVVDHALDQHRERYLAFFELALESTRRATLAEAFGRVSEDAMRLTAHAHRGTGEQPSPEIIAMLNVIYNGVLFNSLVIPRALGSRSPSEITRAALRRCWDENA